MEGSAPGPANVSLDPSLQNGNGNPSPAPDMPTPESGAPTMHPVEASMMAEMQATKRTVENAMKVNRTMSMALFVIGLACIYYLTGKLKVKMPDIVKPPVVL